MDTNVQKHTDNNTLNKSAGNCLIRVQNLSINQNSKRKIQALGQNHA